MSRPRRDDRLLTSILLELEAGGVAEGYLEQTREYRFVHGECSKGGAIVVNPVHSTIDTLIPELLHRLHPKWKESYVRRTTTYLRRRLTDEETQQLYQEYLRHTRRT